MYIKVLGELLVGTAKLIIGQSISETESIAIVEGELQDGWVELTETEYLALGGVIPDSIENTVSVSLGDRVTQLEAVVDTLLGGS